jgi:hypothetical protein
MTITHDDGDVLAFIEDAYARGLTRDQIADEVVDRFTLKQVMDALPAEKSAGRVMTSAELLEFLDRRERDS